MPDPYERHSRPNGCCESWYGQPSRSQLRAAVVAEQVHPEVIPQGKRPPGRKDRNLCKAAHWKGPHQPEFTITQGGWSRGECRWGISWTDPDQPSWICRHEERCAGCGRVLRTSVSSAECPDFRPVTEQEQAAIEAEIVRREQVVPWRRQRPVITGPQGYRKKRSA
jgi:hypothetical protein